MISPAQLSRLWSQYADRLFLIARTLGGSPEDVVQQAFVKLATQHEMPEQPLPWLVRVVRNEAYQWHRSRRRERQREVEASQVSWLCRQEPDPADSLDGAEVTEKLKLLDDQVREVLVLHLWGGMSFEEISTITGMSRSSAHRSYQSGLRQLRTYFQPKPSDVKVTKA